MAETEGDGAGVADVVGFGDGAGVAAGVPEDDGSPFSVSTIDLPSDDAPSLYDGLVFVSTTTFVRRGSDMFAIRI